MTNTTQITVAVILDLVPHRHSIRDEWTTAEEHAHKIRVVTNGMGAGDTLKLSVNRFSPIDIAHLIPRIGRIQITADSAATAHAWAAAIRKATEQ